MGLKPTSTVYIDSKRLEITIFFHSAFYTSALSNSFFFCDSSLRFWFHNQVRFSSNESWVPSQNQPRSVIEPQVLSLDSRMESCLFRIWEASRRWHDNSCRVKWIKIFQNWMNLFEATDENSVLSQFTLASKIRSFQVLHYRFPSKSSFHFSFELFHC